MRILIKIIAVLALLGSVVWIISSPSWEPMVTGLTSLGALITIFLEERAKKGIKGRNESNSATYNQAPSTHINIKGGVHASGGSINIIGASQTVDVNSIVDIILNRLETRESSTIKAVESLRETFEDAISHLHEKARQEVDTPIFEEALKDLRSGNADKAIEAFEIMLSREKRAGKTHLSRASRAARYLGAFSFIQDIERAIKFYQESVHLDPSNADAWCDLGVLLLLTGRTSDALAAFNRSIELAKTMSNVGVLARAKTNLGELYRMTDQSYEAIACQKEALKIHLEIENKRGAAANYANLGVVYWNLSQLQLSEEMLKHSLEIEVQLNNKPGMASDYGNLGVLYLTLGNVNSSILSLQKAEEILHKALEIDQQLKNEFGIAKHLGNLGMVYSSQADHSRKGTAKYKELAKKAEDLVKQSLSLSKKLKYREGEANQYSNLGVLLEESGDKNGAIDAWSKAKDIYASIGMSDLALRMRKWIAAAK